MTSIQYPETASGDDVDLAAGVRFADPYRWLEAESPAVRSWQAAQNTLADDYAGTSPELAASLQRYFVDRIGTPPRFVAGKWFRAIQPSASTVLSVCISDTPYGPGREIPILPPDQDCSHSFLNWIAPSPDGRIVGVGVVSDGSENNLIHLIDLASGKPMPGPPQLLMDDWTGGICWLPDSSGFFFLALEKSATKFRQTVLFHDLAKGTQASADIPMPDPESSDYTLVTVSRDGHWLIAHHALWNAKPIAIRDLRDPSAAWRPFVTDVKGTLTGTIIGNQFVGVTDIDAPRGRVVAIALDTPDPNDSAQWVDVVPESERVLRSLVQVGEHLYIKGYRDTYSEVWVFARDGTARGSVPLPGRGAVAEQYFALMNLVPRGHPDEFYFVFSSLVQSWGVYRHVPGASTLETVRAPAVQIEDAVVTDHWARSADGTLVPYHTVHLQDVPKSGPAPTLLYAYGAFNLALLPEYPGAMAAFVAAGGIYVHGHIRGGAELGANWWHGGRLKNKQNCYADLYAIAEELIAKGLTSKDKLAMTGRSNGGLMAAVAAMQRPDLWRAIVSQVPITDLIAMARHSYGRFVLADEFGDPTDPDEIERIGQFSPYHLVKDSVDYPSIWVEAGSTDPRCPPWQARKFAARLQAAAKPNQRPRLVRVRDNAGHGEATAKAIQMSSYSGWLGFLLRELGVMIDNRGK